MYIVASYEPLDYNKCGEYFRQNHGGGVSCYIIDKPTDEGIVCMKYNGEKYLYVFLFYDFNANSTLKQTLQLFKDYKYVHNQAFVLSNVKLENYDYANESFTDELGGNLCNVIFTIN